MKTRVDLLKESPVLILLALISTSFLILAVKDLYLFATQSYLDLTNTFIFVMLSLVVKVDLNNKEIGEIKKQLKGKESGAEK